MSYRGTISDFQKAERILASLYRRLRLPEAREGARACHEEIQRRRAAKKGPVQEELALDFPEK